MAKTLKRLFAGALATTLVLYLALSPRVSPSLYTDHLFRPHLGRGISSAFTPMEGVTDQDVYFSANDGSRLHGRLFLVQNSKRIVLYNIGSAGDINARLPYVRELLATGVSVFIYEYRGYGTSQGSSDSLQGVCDDGLAAYDYLTSRQSFSAQEVILLGESMGSGVATYVSTKRPAAGLILQSGLYSLERTSKKKLPLLRIYPSILFPRPPLDNARILRDAHPPLLILHGMDDDLVPVNEARELFDRASGLKMFAAFPHSDHYGLDARDRELFRRTIDTYFTSLP